MNRDGLRATEGTGTRGASARGQCRGAAAGGQVANAIHASRALYVAYQRRDRLMTTDFSTALPPQV